jgi:hypothetical protein
MRGELLNRLEKSAIAFELLEETLDEEPFLVNVLVVVPTTPRPTVPRGNDGSTHSRS